MVHRKRYAVFVTFIFILMVGVVRKPNTSCEYPGKSGIRAGSGAGASSSTGMSSPMKG